MGSTLQQASTNFQFQANVFTNDTGTQASPSSKVADNTASTPGLALQGSTTQGTWDWVFSQTYTVASGSPLSINLGSGFNDPIGRSIAAVNVCAGKITNTSGTAGNDIIVGGGSNPLMGADTFTVGAATTNLPSLPGIYAFQKPEPGYIVGSGANVLKITAVQNSITITVTLMGN
jgi:hypothetical protein